MFIAPGCFSFQVSGAIEYEGKVSRHQTYERDYWCGECTRFAEASESFFSLKAKLQSKTEVFSFWAIT